MARTAPSSRARIISTPRLLPRRNGTRGWDPFRDVIIGGCGLAGMLGLAIPGARSNLVSAIIPGFGVVWYTTLLIGALAVAVSWFREPLHGMVIELAGMIWLASLIVPFGVAALMLRGAGYIPSGILVLTLGVACAVRAGQIVKVRSRLSRVRGERV